MARFCRKLQTVHSGEFVKGIMTLSIYATIGNNFMQEQFDYSFIDKMKRLQPFGRHKYHEIQLFLKFATLRHTKNIFFN